MWDVKIKMPLIPARGASEGKCWDRARALWARTLSVGDLRIFSFFASDPRAARWYADMSENNGLKVAANRSTIQIQRINKP